MKPKAANPHLVIVTGLSGSGVSTALKALSDGGMYCIDNLPTDLVMATVDLYENGKIPAEGGLALCMDVRDQKFASTFHELKKKLTDRIRVEVIFLTAEIHVIATRYGATRRKHPLLLSGETLTEAIEREREVLGPVEEAADVVLDTTKWSPHQLARAVEARVSKDLPARVLNVTITSFGFKYGQLQPVDTMFDLRFIENPYFVPELRDLSGLDPEVGKFIFEHENAKELFRRIEDYLRFVLPYYYREGKHYFRVGIGCSGGRHRSVTFAEELGQSFLRQPIPNMITTILHRDIDQ